MTRSRDEVLALHREYEGGVSIEEIGERLHLSYEGVRQLFLKHGLRLQSPTDRATEERAAMLEQAQARYGEVVDLYVEHGSIDDVAERSGLPRYAITPIIDAIPNREAYRRRANTPRTPLSELLSGLLRAAHLKGEPLTIPAYREAARELGLASYNTVIKPFREQADPWQAALKLAGVQGNPARGRRDGTITSEQCIDAVAACISDLNGARCSYREYMEWASLNDAPSGPTIRNLVGWNNAVRQAMAITTRGGAS